jgi:hypothetical protein
MHDRHQDHHVDGSDTVNVTVEADPSVFAHPGDHELRFRITDAGHNTIRAFEEIHERRMHFIVVRNDLAHFKHLHPTLDNDGWWTTTIAFPEAGPYKAFADFSTAGTALTLPLDLHVEGRYEQRPLEDPTDTVNSDGYQVRLIRSTDEATFMISRSGKRVTLAPYLGAMGHLVVLRADDLAFLHVHPTGSDEEGSMRFMLHLPRGPAYKAFLQFIADEAVHTAAFVIRPLEGVV